MTKKIAVIVGSLRKDSWNKKIAEEIIRVASSSLKMNIIPIGALPLFNQDLEETPPQEWVDFRRQISEVDGVLFVTPEYNRSMPAVIKNAIDVASRPYGKSVWNGKPAAVISASVGVIGGFGANQHLRQSLVFLNMPCLQQPEVYLSNVASLYDDKGKLKSSTAEFLKKFADTFAGWVEKIAAKSYA